MRDLDRPSISNLEKVSLTSRFYFQNLYTLLQKKYYSCRRQINCIHFYSYGFFEKYVPRFCMTVCQS